MTLAHYDAPTLRTALDQHLSPAFPFHPPCAPAAGPDGESACLSAYERIRRLEPGFWARLPPRRRPLAVPGHGKAQIAEEIRYAIEYGASTATPQALLLLSSLALRQEGPHAEALGLAEAALALAARLDKRSVDRLRPLHAAVVAPFAGGFDQAAATLALQCEDDAAPVDAALALAGTGLVAGMPLPELARRLALTIRAEDPDEGAAAELAARAQLARGLLHGETDLDVADAGAQRHGHWLALLQAACHAEDLPQALAALARLDTLACPATPLADRLCHHLFAALALARASGAATVRRLHVHCAALRRLARHLPDAEAMRVLADAARAGREGNPLAALRGYEEAAALASRHERHWLAALAWEGAARQAEAAGLGSAVCHYRRAALASHGYWGALGRIDTLRRRWQDPALDGGNGRAADMLRGCGAELGLSIAHEVNQPLAAIALHAAAARKWLRRPVPDIERALSSIALIGDAGRHAGDIVRSMQHLATRAGNARGAIDLDDTIAEVLRLLAHRLCRHGVQVELALGLEGETIHASRTQLQQVLTNLVVNAIEALAADDGAERRIRVASYRAGPDEVEIAIADNGPGIAPQLRERVFGSLFSTKAHGTGMGLAISLAIVRAHGGHLGFEPVQPHGACFRLRLPVRPPLDAA